MTYLDVAGDNYEPLDPRLYPDEVFWPTLTELRERCPVFHSTGNGKVIVTRYDDVASTARDWRNFSSATGTWPVSWEGNAGAFKILPEESDGPYHRSIRDLLNPYFTPRTAKLLEPKFRELATELIDGFCERGSCEFVSEFAEKLPARAVYEGVLGVPRDNFDEVLQWVHAVIFRADDSDEEQAQLLAWSERLLQSRSQADRIDDILDGIAHGVIDGRPLTGQERVQILINTVLGALDTTINALANIAHHLATKPRLVTRLQAADDGVYERAVEEFLRFEAPAPVLGRTATRDTTIAGVEVGKGSHVLMYWAAANRDPRVFPDPDVIDFDRERNNHFAFGWGPHICLGQHIARLELRVALEEIVRRLPNLRLAPGAEIEYRVSISRSPLSLDVEFDPTPPIRT